MVELSECQKTLMHMSFLGCALLYALRVNLSVAIVGMVGHTASHKISSIDECPQNELHSETDVSNSKRGEFDWDERTQGNILGSFFYGYLITNLIGGRLSERFGGKLVFGNGIFLTAILALMVPYAARISTEYLYFIRFLQGMTEGVTFPSLNTLMARWVAPADRAKFISSVLTGMQFGTVITLASSGYLVDSVFGWPSVFYVFGVLALIWSFFWYKYIADNPSQHPHITHQEKERLIHALGDSRTVSSNHVPWQDIFSSRPVLALIAAHVGHNWGAYYLLTELPTYLSTVHHFDMKNSGFISALPFLCMWGFSIAYARWAERSLEQKRMSVMSVRKVSMILSLAAPGVFLLCVSYVGCRSYLAVTIICLSVSLTGAAYCGYHCGFQELAPNYAGTLTGISNTFATIPGFLAPMFTGIIINHEPTIAHWHDVFLMTAIIYFVSSVIYCWFVSVDVQPWNSGRRRIITLL